jgi:plastocyanin
MSNINPNNIDGSYPIAGQDNDSQGFRDNFTNIVNNFNFAKSEIDDLQNKVVLKSALTGTTLNNNMAGSIIGNVELRSSSQSIYNYSSASGTVALNYNLANFFYITTAGSISFSISNVPISKFATITVWVNVTSVGHTVTFPSAVNIGMTSVAGQITGSRVITFEATGTYGFQLTSYDGTNFAIQDLTRNRITANTLTISGDLTVGGSFTPTSLILVNINTTGLVLGANLAANSGWSGNSLDVNGGGRIGGNVYLGSNLNATVGNTVTILANVDSSGTSVGALVVQGGTGIAGNLNVGGNVTVTSNLRAASNLVTSGGRVNSGYILANVVNNQNIFANTAYNLWIANASPHPTTIANLRFTLPASAEDGREITLRVQGVPTTTFFVSNGSETSTTANTVYWIANNFASTGNVTAKFMYSTATSRWFRTA